MVVPARIRAALAGTLAVLTVSTLLATPASATAPQTLNRVDAASGWLAVDELPGEPARGGVAYPDAGLTVDALFSFAAAKSVGANGAAAAAWLAQPAITAGYVGDGTEAYAGATAKLALAAQVRGLDPTNFGGVDLLTRLRGLQAPSGRFADRSGYGDYSNAFSQSFALIALDRAGGAPAAAVSFLVGSRCADGGFPMQFAQATCESDVDATAMAVQALTATGRWAAATAGARWLVGAQASDGSFSYYGSANANSTGLAAQALVASGRLGAWLKARQFLIGLQVGCSGAVADRGAIAYTAAGFDPSTARRATAQALPGAAGVGFGTLSAAGSVPAAPVLACAGS